MFPVRQLLTIASLAHPQFARVAFRALSWRQTGHVPFAPPAALPVPHFQFAQSVLQDSIFREPSVLPALLPVSTAAQRPLLAIVASKATF